ncbi:MAG: FAD-dependent oxidoreductase, partial [Rhabdaerophilum sp.]
MLWLMIGLPLSCEDNSPSLAANRGSRTRRHSMSIFDLAVIGGGINGAGIARDAAGRGLRVLLIEKS